MEKLHPGAKWQFRISGYILLGILVFFGMIIFPFMDIFNTDSIVTIDIFTILICLLLVVIISEIFAQMSYNRWFYDFTDDGLRLERGIIWKRYSNVPYERIQNVDVHRGIIARMFGFSSVMIQTAGFSGPAGAEGNIPAVEMKHAEEIRNFVMKKIQAGENKNE